MRRFQFRLRALERVRELRRREARAALARALGTLRECENRRLECRRRFDEALRVTLPQDRQHDPAAWKELEAWRRSLEQRLLAARRSEDEARDEAERAGDGYAEAAREHRVLEQLHQRQRQRWQAEAEREDRKFLDEVQRHRDRRVES